jgi:hypothetical protein
MGHDYVEKTVAANTRLHFSGGVERKDSRVAKIVVCV